MVWTSLVEGIEKEQSGRLKVVKLNVTAYQALARALHILSSPGILIFKGGKEIRVFSGNELSYEDLEKVLQTL